MLVLLYRCQFLLVSLMLLNFFITEDDILVEALHGIVFICLNVFDFKDRAERAFPKVLYNFEIASLGIFFR